MSVKLLLLSALLLALCVTVKAGASCPALEAPPSESPSIRNIPLFDTRNIQDFAFRNNIIDVDGDSNGFVIIGGCVARLEACNATPSQDNWAITDTLSSLLNGAQANSIQVVLEFSLNCTESLCSDSFGLYVSESPPGPFNFSTYTVVQMPPISGTTYSIPLTGNSFSIGLRDTGTCVTVERLQVYHSVCVPTFANTIIPFGGSTTVDCVSNTVTSSGSTSCSAAGELSPANPCECQAGYSGANGMNCTACEEGMFKSVTGSGSCTPCPMFTEALGTANAQCDCVKGHMRSNPGDITTACDQCLAGYFVDGSVGCSQCPIGSNSTGGTESTCTCDNGLATSDGSTSTTIDHCDHCISNFFRNGGECMPCPAMSSRASGDANDSCLCPPGRATPSNTTTTTAEECSGCQSTHYLDGDNCFLCPSGRVAPNPDDVTCVCLDGFSRLSGAVESTTEDCVVILGFTMNAIPNARPEGASIGVSLKAGAATSVTVSLDSSNDAVIDTSPVAFGGSNQVNFNLTVQENEVALENYSPVTISIQSVSSMYQAGGTLGGVTVYDSLTVNVVDNDDVTVGFTVPSERFNETQGTGTVTVRRVGGIASPLVLMIGEDSDIISINNPMITFDPSSSVDAMTDVPFSIIDDNSGVGRVRSTTLRLTLVSPMEFSNSVLLEGTSGLSETIQVEILNDEPPPTAAPLGLGVIIGISVGGAAVIILAFFILILVICICHLRSVNRQGFYTTHEDQSKEPPTMLRYSASLRSISSQTVVPVANAQGSVTKEHEFYV